MTPLPWQHSDTWEKGEAETSLHSMATLTSIDAVRRKIQTLQQVAYEAEDRAELLQEEADMERQARERVHTQHTQCLKADRPETIANYQETS